MKKSMKKGMLMLTMALFACVMVLSSCSKKAESLVGSWKLVSLSDNVGGYIAEDSWDLNEIWEFTADGNFLVDDDQAGTYTYDSKKNTLTLSEYGISISFEVKKLTSSTMQLLYYDVLTMNFEKQ